MVSSNRGLSPAQVKDGAVEMMLLRRVEGTMMGKKD